MDLFIALAATQVATVYGYGEHMCGDVGQPRPCDHRAVTASGDRFKPMEITAAVPAPKKKRIYGYMVFIKDYKGNCIPVKVNDKKAPRYVGKGGLDLTPGAVWAITGKLPNRHWSGKIELCSSNEVPRPCSSTSSQCSGVTR
jgi:hypothetical protein